FRAYSGEHICPQAYHESALFAASFARLTRHPRRYKRRIHVMYFTKENHEPNSTYHLKQRNIILMMTIIRPIARRNIFIITPCASHYTTDRQPPRPGHPD